VNFLSAKSAVLFLILGITVLYVEEMRVGQILTCRKEYAPFAPKPCARYVAKSSAWVLAGSAADRSA